MSVAITVSLIILLAGFGIFNVLTMSVLAKIKEIAICDRWATAGGYQRNLSLAGRIDAAAGSVIGCLLGALMTWGVCIFPSISVGCFTQLFLVTWDWHHYLLRRSSRLWLCS